jgi:hypothetical protein
MITKGTQQQKFSYHDNQQTTRSRMGSTQSMINTTKKQCFGEANISTEMLQPNHPVLGCSKNRVRSVKLPLLLPRRGKTSKGSNDVIGKARVKKL